MSADEADPLSMPLVLLVEDEVLIREMLVDVLEAAGFSTLVSGDAQGAATLFKESGGEIQVLVTDINLGDYQSWRRNGRLGTGLRRAQAGKRFARGLYQRRQRA